MPLNASNKYIWVRSATPEPYTVLEGKVVTENEYESIITFLDKSLNNYTAFETNSSLYSVSTEGESIFNMLILKKDLTFGIVWMGDMNLKSHNLRNHNFMENLDIFIDKLESAVENGKEKNKVELSAIKHQVSIYE